MKLAVNFSPQAATLLSKGIIAFDYFKCPDWPGLIAEASAYRPVRVHSRLKAGNGKLNGKGWEELTDLMEQTGTPFINLHLMPSPKHFPGIPQDTPETHQVEQIVESMRKDIQAAVKYFGGERVIVENVPYRILEEKVMRPSVEPAIISQLIEETGCGLLLDVSHARISANQLGWDEREYMEQLPVKRLCELHFTGVQNLNNSLQDHLPALEADWQALEWVFDRIRSGAWAVPSMLAFEYGGVGEKFAWRSDPAVLSEQVPRLLKIVNSFPWE